MSKRIPFDQLPAPQQAAILGQDARFCWLLAEQSSATTDEFTASEVAEFIRHHCGIESRRELTTNPDAAEKFQRLRTEFDAHIGKISRPR